VRVILGCFVFAVVALYAGATTATLPRVAEPAGMPPAHTTAGSGTLTSPAEAAMAVASVDVEVAPASQEWPGMPAPSRPSLQRPGGPYEFYFTRGIYCCGRSWRTDYPKADEQFMHVLTRLVDIDASPASNAIQLDDPNIRRFPFLYILEVGGMRMTPAEVEGLRDYLLAGGFLVVDDFWGTWEWANFEREIRRVFPDRPIVEVPLSHPIFNLVYTIDEILQVPARGNYQRTWERDGYEPFVRGIFDDEGRLMVLINGNTDLGDAWEWAELPDYPLVYSTYAFRMGVNFIVYAMSY